MQPYLTFGFGADCAQDQVRLVPLRPLNRRLRPLVRGLGLCVWWLRAATTSTRALEK